MHLIADDLSARRGDDFIFMNVSLRLSAGEALLLTGPNGSGKSTLLRVLAGLMTAERGTVKIAGEGVDDGMRPAEASHYLGHRNAMKHELTVRENLSFWKRFLGDFDNTPSLDIEEAADRVGLSGITHLPFGYLSAGQQRRFAMAKLLVASRPIWILDEPTAALDAQADRMFTGLVASHLDQGGIVIAATHQPLGLETAMELRMTGFAGTTQFGDSPEGLDEGWRP